MDSHCAKFGDFSFSRFDRQTDRHYTYTESHTHTHTETQNYRTTDVDDRYTHATTVGVSNYDLAY